MPGLPGTVQVDAENTAHQGGAYMVRALTGSCVQGLCVCWSQTRFTTSLMQGLSMDIRHHSRRFFSGGL